MFLNAIENDAIRYWTEVQRMLTFCVQQLKFCSLKRSLSIKGTVAIKKAVIQILFSFAFDL